MRMKVASPETLLIQVALKEAAAPQLSVSTAEARRKRGQQKLRNKRKSDFWKAFKNRKGAQ